jgi:hypothetical protein
LTRRNKALVTAAVVAAALGMSTPAVAFAAEQSSPATTAAACGGVKFKWKGGGWSGCYERGQHDFFGGGGKGVSNVNVASGYMVFVTCSNDRNKTYRSGNHSGVCGSSKMTSARVS